MQLLGIPMACSIVAVARTQRGDRIHQLWSLADDMVECSIEHGSVGHAPSPGVLEGRGEGVDFEAMLTGRST